MQIESVRIVNFRSFADQTINLNNYTCLVGANGSGKSTVLHALNLFFRNTYGSSLNASMISAEDFHLKQTDNPIEITVTFSALSAEASEDLQDYVRQGRLVVTASATYDQDAEKAELRQYGNRLGIADFRPFFEAESGGVKVADLKSIYSDLRGSHPDLPAPGTKAAMVEALREYEAERPEECELIRSEDQFYGVSRGENRLAKHVQWVYVPAAKDAVSEQVESKNTALGQLLARTVRARTNFDESVTELRQAVQDQYQELLDENQHVLSEVSRSLQDRLSEWAHPDATLRLEWKQDPGKSVRLEEPWAHIQAGEGHFEGELSRFGHGLQRSYLLALLQELANTSDESAPTLLLGCEEPELYQHPPQARHLATVLRNLSITNAQVFVTTHDPRFVSGEGFEDVRMVRRETGAAEVSGVTFAEIADSVSEVTDDSSVRPEGILAQIHQSLQPGLSEMFFTRRLILVEGLEDVAYILAYIQLMELTRDFQSSGAHLVSAQGKSELIRPLVVAKRLRIPTYLVFDCDAAAEDRNGSREKHRKDNQALFRLCGMEDQDPLPNTSLWCPGLTAWHSDIGTVVEQEIGSSAWEDAREQACSMYGHTKGWKKNTLHIATRLAITWDAGFRSDSLARLCNGIVDEDNRLPYHR